MNEILTKILLNIPEHNVCQPPKSTNIDNYIVTQLENPHAKQIKRKLNILVKTIISIFEI